jgi:hypothetical protein
MKESVRVWYVTKREQKGCQRKPLITLLNRKTTPQIPGGLRSPVDPYINHI